MKISSAAALIALALVISCTAEAAPMQASGTVARVGTASAPRPTKASLGRHWLSDGLHGLSVLLPRHSRES